MKQVMSTAMTGLRLSCGACKFLRRKCKNGCIFAPYFYYDQAESHFAAVHKVFGASNVSKHLSNLPVHYRSEAAITISYEALARVQDDVYGCVGHIFALQQQVAQLQKEIELLEVHFANQATNFVSGQSSQLATNFNSAPQFSAELDIMNSLSYGGEEPPEPFHARYSNLTLADDMNPQISLLTPWAEQTSGFDSANEPKIFLSDPLSDIAPWSNTGNPLASYSCPLDVTSL